MNVGRTPGFCRDDRCHICYVRDKFSRTTIPPPTSLFFSVLPSLCPSPVRSSSLVILPSSVRFHEGGPKRFANTIQSPPLRNSWSSRVRVRHRTHGQQTDLTPRVHYRASVIKVSRAVGLFAGRTFKYERGNATRSAVPPDGDIDSSGIIDADFNYSQLFALIEKSRENSIYRRVRHVAPNE